MLWQRRKQAVSELPGSGVAERPANRASFAPSCPHPDVAVVAVARPTSPFLLRNGEGVSQDTPLANMYMHQRTLRLADGPDAVHRMVVGRHELRQYGEQAAVNATFRDG